MKTIKVQAEDSIVDVEIADYKKSLIKEFNVKDYNHPEHGKTEAKKIVDHIVDSLVKDREVDGTIKDDFSELFDRVESDVKFTKENSESKAEKSAREKEEKEAAKAAEAEKAKEKAEALAVRQEAIVEAAAAGVDLAANEFAEELKNLGESLPEGVTVAHKGTGYGLSLPDDATEATIGSTIGYLLQKSANSQFIGNQLYFWVGDIISFATNKGIFTTAKEASEKIAKLLEEKHGKKIHVVQLDEYKRMAERTPLELRNPTVDISAYNAVAKIKVPTKGEKESDESYKSRVTAFEKDKKALQEKLASGETTKKKDIDPAILELQYTHGLKERPDPNAQVVTASSLYQQLFHTIFALENLVATHEDHPNAAVYKDGENLIPVSKEDLEEKRDEALASLGNMFYTSKKLGLNPKDFARGFIEKTQEVVVGKDADGKNIKEAQKSKVPVYPAPFWEVAKSEG